MINMSIEKAASQEEQTDSATAPAKRALAKGSTPLRVPFLCAAFLVFLAVAQFPFTDGYRMQRNQSSCYYNGTHFMEGSIVPTKEPCLMCKCTEKTLICALKVCPEQPIPPPRGCILVHKSASCCPYLQCSKLNLALKNHGDRKKIHFLDYYEKAAQERLENANSYLRRSDDDDVEDNGACIVNGTVYKSGSAMISSSLCSYCYCINGRQKCVRPKCALANQKCAPIFVDSTCCPIRYDCSGKTPIKNVATDQSTVSPNQVRRINNKHYQRMSERRGYRSNGCTMGVHTYPDGEKMKSEDPCEVCFCIRGQRKCTPKKCAPPIKGCTPRVPRGECCAVRYDCKHGEPKPFGRKMEDEESFDFFSILFGPDPDAPKADAKNATKTIEAPVTETAPVSTTSEKSFLDLLRAGLDFIDDAGEDELLLTTTLSSGASKPTSTESAPELQTVKVEIIQEPQAIYIEKPDFNFPVRKIPPVPIMFKPLPKIPTLLMNEPNFQNLESDSLLKETPSEVSNSLTETTVKNVLTTEAIDEKSSEASSHSTKEQQTSSTPTEKQQISTTSMPPTAQTTQKEMTTSSTTRATTTKLIPAASFTTTTTTKRTTTQQTTTTPTPPTTTTEQPVTTSVTAIETTAKTTQPTPTITSKVELSEMAEAGVPSTTIDPVTKAYLTISSNSSSSQETMGNSPKITMKTPLQVNTSASSPMPTQPIVEMTTVIPITTTSTITTTTTSLPLPSEKIIATTTKNVGSTPVDVVIKIDQLVDKATVESIINSLNAKIEKVTKVIPNEPITTTTVATKRPNNKFVEFAPEKRLTNVLPKISTTTTEPMELTSTIKDVTTLGVTEIDDPTTTEPEISTVMKENTERLTEEASSSTPVDSEEYSTITSNVPSELTTSDGASESTTDIVYSTTNTQIEAIREELKTVLMDSENNDTITSTPSTTSVAPSKPTVTSTRPPNPLKENNLLSVLLSGLSNIFDATKNDSGKQSQRNRTEYRPTAPKPIPISGFHKVSSIPSILESDVGLDYDEPTLPPSLPNLKIIPFLPADAVKKNDPLQQAKLVPPTYTYFKNHPNNYPIINDPYDAPTAYGLGNEHEVLHPGLSYKSAAKPLGEYEYTYDPTINYPALTENYEIDAKNGYYNTKIIRDKYDTVDETDYDYDTDTIHKYSELPQKQDLFQNELKKFIPTKYEVPQEGTYVPVYDKYGVGYPEKNVYYTNHKELAYGGAKLDKVQSSTDNPVFRIDGTDTSGFSPPTKTEGGFVPKEPSKDEFYYESYGTTALPIELTTDDHHAKLPYNVTPSSSYGATPANPFIDVIRTEQAPPLLSLIEDKEKLLSTLQTKNTSFEDNLGDPSAGGDDFEKQIISITTDANYLSSVSDDNPPTRRTTPSKPNFTGFELNFPVSVDHSVEPVSPAPKPVKTSGTKKEPEPTGMFSLENMLNYLLREEDSINENKLRNGTRNDAGSTLVDGIPPFKTLPSRLAAVYDPSAGLEASMGDVDQLSDEELHEGTVTLKVESAKNDTKALYRPSLLDLPFLNPGFHTKSINQPDTTRETQNELERHGYNAPEHHADPYQVIAERSPIVNTNSYVVNPVDINKLKQHHSEGTAEINMKAKVKDTVGILKLAGCNIYGRMYRVGRIISELSGPCLECKCTEVGVHCTPLDCRKRR